MGVFKKVGRAIGRAVRDVRHFVTTPLTHGIRHKIEDQYHAAVAESARLEQEALMKLQAHYKVEAEKADAYIKHLQETIKNNEEQFKLEQDKLNQYLEAKGKAIQESLDYINKGFKALRAALWACVTGKEEDIEQFIKPVLKRDLALKARFLALYPLHIATDNNHFSLIVLLLQEGADPQSKNPDGKSPIEIAEESGLQEAVQILKMPVLEETVALWQAVEAGDKAAMETALNRGAALNACLPNGRNILQQAVLDKRRYETIHWLVEKGADYYHVSMRSALDSDHRTKDQFKATHKTDLVTKVPINASILGKDVFAWFYIKQFNRSPKQVADSRALSEAREGTHAIPSIVTLAKHHPDWRVRDFLMGRIGTQAASPLHFAWQSSLESARMEEGASTLKFGRNQSQFGFITLDNRKKFFALSSTGQPSSSLIHYHFAQKSWQYHSMGLSSDQSGRTSTIGHRLQKLSVMPKTKENQEQLLVLASVLAPQQGEHLIVWRYESTVQRWQASRLGPKQLLEQGSMEQADVCTGKEALFLLRQKTRAGNDRELWRYLPRNDEWVSEPCTINGVLCLSDGVRDSRPQLFTLSTRDGIERLFVFLLRNNVFELWNYEPLSRVWTQHARSPWSGGWGFSFPVLQLQKVNCQGECRPFFLEFSSTAMKLWDFNPETGLWTHHPGGPGWSLTESGYHPTMGLKESLSVIQLQTVPSYEDGTDIILLFKQTFQAPTECYAYHPLHRRWASVLIPGLAESIWNDKNNRSQISVERFGNQYRLILFAQREQGLENLLDHPFSITKLENALSGVPTVSAPLVVFSEEEDQRTNQFIARRDQVSHALLSAAGRGDWSAVFASLAEGADIHATEDGHNALQLALRHPSLDMGTLQRLLKAGLAVYRPSLELARGQGLIEIHNYLADLLDRPALRVWDVETQFRASYAEHFNRAKRSLDKYPSNIKKCEVILNYYHLVSSRNPYVVYAWPGLLLLGETLLLSNGTLTLRPDLLRNVQNLFMQTFATHKALAEVGVEQADLLRSHSEFENLNWTPVVAAIQLREASEQVEAKTQAETLRQVYHQYRELLIEGTRIAVSRLLQALELEPDSLEDITQWVVAQQIHSPYLFKEYYKTRFHAQFTSLASVAREAIESNLIPPAPKLSLIPLLHSVDEQESAAREPITQAEQAFKKEKEELQQWLTKREAEYLACLHELETLIEANQGMDAKLKAEFQRAAANLNNEFARFRQELYANKEDALRKVRKDAFKTVVITAAAFCVAYAVAPALAAGINSAASLGLSKAGLTALEVALKGGIMGGIQGAFNKEGMVLGALKGAGFAFLGREIGGVVGQLIPAAPELLQLAVSSGIESLIHSHIEGGHVGRGLMTDIGTGLILGKEDTSTPKKFMQTLRDNLWRGFVRAGVQSAVSHQHLSSSLATACVMTTISTCASATGSMLENSFRNPQPDPEPLLPPEVAFAAAIGGAPAGLAAGLGMVAAEVASEVGAVVERGINRGLSGSRPTRAASSRTSNQSSSSMRERSRSHSPRPHHAASNRKVPRLRSHSISRQPSQSSLLTAYNNHSDNYRRQRIDGFPPEPSHSPVAVERSGSSWQGLSMSSRDATFWPCQGILDERVPLYSFRNSYWRGASVFAGSYYSLNNQRSAWDFRSRPSDYYCMSRQKPFDSRSGSQQFRDLMMLTEASEDAFHNQDPAGAGFVVGLGLNTVKFIYVDIPVATAELAVDVMRVIDDPAHRAYRARQLDYLSTRISEDPWGVAQQVLQATRDYLGNRWAAVQQEYALGNRFTAGFMASELAVDVGGCARAGQQLLFVGAKAVAKGAALGGRGLASAANEVGRFTSTHTLRSPIIPDSPPPGITYFCCGPPLKFQKPYVLDPVKKHTQFLEKRVGASIGREHVDLHAGVGGVHTYENFASAREAAKVRANLGDDAVPFLQELGPYKDKVYTGMKSPDGTRGWRFDYDTRTRPEEVIINRVHINWWFRPDPSSSMTFKGRIPIDGATEGFHREMIRHFPKT